MSYPLPPFSAARFAQLARERGLAYGQPLLAKPHTVSTSDDALEALRAGAASGSVFVADAQSAGRGRNGRSWSSLPGHSLTFSLILRPKLPPERLQQTTLAVGLALREALAACGARDLCIKWPNDIVQQRRKLAGILVEKPQLPASDTAVVVGVGINLGFAAVPAELVATATALDQLVAAAPSLETLLADVLQHIAEQMDLLENEGFAPLAHALREHDALLGQRIVVDGRAGIGRGIHDDGLLLFESGGTLHTLNAGTVLFA